MRIVGGRLRGRGLARPRSQDIRPTSDRLRETVFNILAHGHSLPGPETRVLDLFAGTGALGLEALSRGAAHAVFVESGTEGRGLIRSNIEALGLAGVTRILRRDATELGDAGTIAPFDLVFCDPPYGKALGEKALAGAAGGGWLNAGAICVVEERAGVTLQLSSDFTAIDRREIGESQIVILRYASSD